MTPEEQAALDGAQSTARNATRDLAIARATPSHPWVMTADAEAELGRRASFDEAGALRFLSDKKGENNAPVFTDAAGAASELAASRPHWVKATLTPGTGAPGSKDGGAPPAAATTYNDLLKPANADRLRDYLTNRPDELARMRDAHFER